MNYDKSQPLAGFHFFRAGDGYYKVTYQSDYDVMHNRLWQQYIFDSTIIDATLHSERPKRKDVERLRRLVKDGGAWHYE